MHLILSSAKWRPFCPRGDDLMYIHGDIYQPGSWFTKKKSCWLTGIFQTWHLIGWQHSYQSIKSHVRKSLFIHWGRATHMCVIIGSDIGLSPDRRQAIIWSNAGILLIRTRSKLQWNIKRNSYIFIQENSFENVVCEMAAILSRPQCVKNMNFNMGCIQ